MMGGATSANAQRAQFGDFFQVQGPPNSNFAPNQSIITSPNLQITPPPSQFLQQPQAFPNQAFPNQAFPNAGQIINAPTLTTPSSNPFQQPNQRFPIFPRGNQRPVLAPPNVQPQFGNQPQFGGQPQFGSPQYPNRWPYEGTGSNWLPSIDWSVPQQYWQQFQNNFLPRLLERPRVRQTFLQGNSGNELNINDIEVATTMTFPNFLQSRQPLRMSPNFIFHYWDGPDSIVHPGYDLPARAYSTSLAFDHMTNPANQSGLESNFTVGFYSDFKNTSSDAIRLTGRILGWQRLNQYTVGKLGVEYFDRINVKLLPVVGVYMTPNADMKFDLTFPRSKLSHRVPNFADNEAWVYIGGEYGGGSWAIERADSSEDQADINDVRAFLGVEWMGARRVTGFFEFGYVFQREIVYRSDPMNSLELQDTLMIRSGLAF